MCSPTSFHQFPNLPFELRWQIWELALPGPRILHLRETDPTNPNFKPNVAHSKPREDIKWTISAQIPPPSLLLVNRESFAFASQHFELAFPTKRDAQWPDLRCARTWINFERDTVYLNDETFIQRNLNEFGSRGWNKRRRNHWQIEGGENIKNLAIKANDFLGPKEGCTYPSTSRGVVLNLIKLYPRMRKIDIVVSHTSVSKYDPFYTAYEAQELVFVDLPEPELININRALTLYERTSEKVPMHQVKIHEEQLENFRIEERVYDIHSASLLRPQPDLNGVKYEYRVMCSAGLRRILLAKMAEH